MKQGSENDLIDRIRATPYFKPILDDLPELLDPQSFVGRAPQQVLKFCGGEVEEALSKYVSKFILPCLLWSLLGVIRGLLHLLCNTLANEISLAFRYKDALNKTSGGELFV